MAKAKKKAKATNKKVIYKKVVIVVEDHAANLAVQCVRIKGDFELSVGDQITVSGELKKNKGMLEFGTGCTYVKVADDRPKMSEEAVDTLKYLQEGDVYQHGMSAVSGRVETVEKVKSDAPQKISHYVGALTMFVAAVFYMLMSDLTFNNTADRLIIAVLLSFGSAILFFLSSNLNEKPVLMFLFKEIAKFLAVGFVVYIHFFMKSQYYLVDVIEKMEKAGLSKVKELVMTRATMVISLVLGYVSIVAQSANTILVATLKED